MSVEQNPILNPALSPLKQQPFPSGSNSIYTAGQITQQNQAKLQTSLAQNGGVKKSRKMKGGTTSVLVNSFPSYTPNQAGANAANTEIASLALSTQNNATYDNVNTQSEVAKIAASQSQGKTGGSKRGGSWPVWSCLSGGKKSRKYSRRKSCKCNRRKHKKTRKHLQRRRH